MACELRPQRPIEILASAALGVALAATSASAADETVPSWTQFGEGLPYEVAMEVGDTLSWPTFSIIHNVFELPNASEGDRCNLTGKIKVDDGAGNASFTFASAGTFYFGCDVGAGSHCGSGNMRVKVTVTEPPPPPVPAVRDAGLAALALGIAGSTAIAIARRRRRAG